MIIKFIFQHDLPPPIIDWVFPAPNSGSAMVNPSIRFSYSEASQRLEATSDNSIVLSDTVRIGRNRIQIALQHQVPHYHWVALYYDDS
jgi:hypothetical protein